MDNMIVDEPTRSEHDTVQELPIRTRPSDLDGEDSEMLDAGLSDTESVDIIVDPEFATEIPEPNTELYEDSGDDAQNVGRDRIILVRVIFYNHFATQPFHVPARKGHTMGSMLRAIHKKLPATTIENRFDEKLEYVPAQDSQYEPLFILQEASFRTPAMRRTKWVVVKPNTNNKAYYRWFDRNVIRGSEMELKMEVRIRDIEAIEQMEDLAAAGRDEAVIEGRRYVKIDIDKLWDPDVFWRYVEHSKTVAVQSIDLTKPSTAEWFPERDGPIDQMPQAWKQWAPASQAS
ncbi:hypothetical protein EDD37DRAFT_654153 [Exophiala viscosa]|uniref:Uncharacterized protein n=1 Tax=Exophiala viscosa TaxID=2486360 RepID=A0AAN6I8L3_9EURO|nr:hypothetical protein EDD36DRAFT_423577 [Exophiala viscosa]KAI1620044.1 hypothetical protein EDD37DRAFT_654153 [Exophiala viscosa]